MYFCIRDDDTSFFTSPDELEKAYGKISEWGPISLAVVPFHRAGASKAVPEKLRGRWSIHPIHENVALVRYLRCGVSNKRFEIMLHGYHHDDPERLGEFLSGSDLTKKVSDGRKYLEDLLAIPVRVFVPPRNIIGKDGLRAIARAGLHLGGVAGVRAGWPLRSRTTWRKWLHLRRWRKNGGVGVPWVLELGDHREIAGNAVTPSASLVRNREALDCALKIDGVFCLATHYWELSAPSKNPNDPTVGDHLRYFIDVARSDHRILWRSVGDVITGSTSTL